MADSPAKRNREAKKRRKKQLKEERKRIRKETPDDGEVDMHSYFPEGTRPPQNAEDALRLKRLSEARDRKRAKTEDLDRETGS